MSDYTRITGLASGMDTENMIKDMMKAESQKKIKVERQKQYVEWEKEAYQDISKMLREYKNTNFDLLSPSTNFRSPTMFAEFTSSVISNGEETNALTVTGNANISKLSHTIDSINQLATKDLYESTTKLKTKIEGLEITDISTVNNSIAIDGNDTFVINFDGISKSITLEGGYVEQQDLIDDMNTKIADAFGADKITVSGIEISPDPDPSVDNMISPLTITANESGHQTTILASDDNILGNIGFTSGDSDYIKSDETLATAFGVSGVIDIEINGVSDFGITSSDTVKTMMEKINDSDADVTMSYSQLSGKINIESNETGAVNKIDFGETTNTFLENNLLINVNAVENIDDADGYIHAKDARFSIDGVMTSRSNNDFTIDGANYSLNKVKTDFPITVELSPDTDGLVEKITSFVDKYNEIIETLNGKLDEERYYDYQALSADEKEAMTEDDIETWEEKAKSGVLGSSNELQNIATQMRTLIYEPIEGLDISLRDIGITTSSNYKENGKLTIDENQLKESINNNYAKVVNLFTKTSDIDYDDGANRAQRKAESGIANRLYDVLQDNIRNTRDKNGNKGILIEKAGYPNELSDLNNIINDRIKDYDDRIDDLIDYLADKEDYYYQMFAQMEKAMTEMQSQSGWLEGNM